MGPGAESIGNSEARTNISSRLKAQRRPSAVGGALRLRLEAKWLREEAGRLGRVNPKRAQSSKLKAQRGRPAVGG